MKYLKIDAYKCCAAALIAFAAGLRFVLAALGWPPTNSDEGTMALMARNIAYRGDHPALFYGQDYMGSLEAYLGALFFHLFGSASLFALRSGVILLVTLFLICMYLLTSLLFSKKLALITLAFLSVGSIPMLSRQMLATGGSSQTLLFGALSFLLAAWLALTSGQTATMRRARWRLLAYAAWGLVIGLGLWSDMVVLPIFALATVLLLVFCWRELLPWRWLVVLACTFIGMLPLLLYDLQHSLNPFKTVLGLSAGSNAKAPETLSGLIHNLLATTQVSIPTATGDPFCPVQEQPWLGDTSPHILPCTLAHAFWGDGYLLLLILALLFIWNTLRRAHRQNQPGASGSREDIVRHVAQLLLGGGALLTIALYALSSGPVDQPAFHARYLVGLLIATPALLAPLWHAASRLTSSGPQKGRMKGALCAATLLLIWFVLLSGTIIAFSEVPAAQMANARRQDLIQRLLQLHTTHIYTEYWTCNSLAFASNERIVCAVLDYRLRPTHNRVPGYLETVQADPHAAYVFPTSAPTAFYDGLPAVERMVAQAPPGSYQRYVFDGYVVYQPAG